jgi:hypothetical protein
LPSASLLAPARRAVWPAGLETWTGAASGGRYRQGTLRRAGQVPGAERARLQSHARDEYRRRKTAAGGDAGVRCGRSPNGMLNQGCAGCAEDDRGLTPATQLRNYLNRCGSSPFGDGDGPFSSGASRFHTAWVGTDAPRSANRVASASRKRIPGVHVPLVSAACHRSAGAVF